MFPLLMKLLSVSSSPYTWPRPQHPDDVIEVRSLRLADTGSYVDQDDEVAEVLEDREVVSPPSLPPSLPPSYLLLSLPPSISSLFFSSLPPSLPSSSSSCLNLPIAYYLIKNDVINVHIDIN